MIDNIYIKKPVLQERVQASYDWCDPITGQEYHDNVLIFADSDQKGYKILHDNVYLSENIKLQADKIISRELDQERLESIKHCYTFYKQDLENAIEDLRQDLHDIKDIRDNHILDRTKKLVIADLKLLEILETLPLNDLLPVKRS